MCPGHTLAGRYRLADQVGQGGTAAVFRGYDTPMQREVAVKTFPASAFDSRLALEQFTADVRVLGRLEHPHILPIYDCGHDEGTPFVIMRFADSGSLGGELARGLPSLPRVDDVIGQAARGLDHAHREGYIHRDIKPQNILVEATGDIYLDDLSLAVPVLHSQTPDDQQMTSGTAYYMQPEQAQA